MSEGTQLQKVVEPVKPLIVKEKRRREIPFKETWLKECLDQRHAECPRISRVIPDKVMNLSSFRGVCICKCHKEKDT